MSWRKIREAREREERRNWWVIGGIVLACAAFAWPMATGEKDAGPWVVAVFAAACLIVYGLRAFGRHTALVCSLLMITGGALYVLAPKLGRTLLVAVPVLAFVVLDTWARLKSHEGPTMPDSIADNKREKRRRFLDWARRRKKAKRAR